MADLSTKVVGFKFGTQEKADEIIGADSGAIEGSFYLTDAHRLYVGAESESNAGQYTLYAVNEGVTTIQNLESLKNAIPSNAAARKAMTGRFYYLTDENILAVFNGQAWVQINNDTDNSISSMAFEGTADADNNTQINLKVSDASGTEKNAAFNILTAGGVLSTFDATTKTLTITGDTYTLTSTTSSTPNTVTLHLGSTNVDDGSIDSDVSITGSGSVVVSQEDNVITVSAEDCSVAHIDIWDEEQDEESLNRYGHYDPETGNPITTWTGMHIQVSDSKGNTATGLWQPEIKYGADETNPYKVQFINNVATLDVYGKNEIDQLLKDLNGMTYKGTVGDSGSYGAGFNIGSGTKWIRNSSGDQLDSHIGDMVVLSNEQKIGDKLYSKGTIVVCRSSDGTETNGVIPASKLEFDIIEAEQNTDTQYVLTAFNDTSINGLMLYSNSGDDVGEFKFAQGSLGDVSITVNGVETTRSAVGANILVEHDEYDTNSAGVTKATFKFKHQLVARTDDDTKTEAAVDDVGLTFKVVESIESDDTGHITKVITKNVTIPDNQSAVSDVSVETNTYQSSDKKTTVGTVKTSVTTQTVGGSTTTKEQYFTLNSKSLEITNKDDYGPTAESETSNKKEGLSIEMVWGSF